MGYPKPLKIQVFSVVFHCIQRIVSFINVQSRFLCETVRGVTNPLQATTTAPKSCSLGDGGNVEVYIYLVARLMFFLY